MKTALSSALFVFVFLSFATAQDVSVQKSVSEVKRWMSQSPEPVKLTGDDIRNISTMVENYKAPEVIAFLNESDNLQKLISICPLDCRRLFLAGIASPNLEVASKSKAEYKKALSSEKKATFEDLFSSIKFYVNPENQDAYSEMRLKYEMALSQISNNPQSEKAIVKDWALQKRPYVTQEFVFRQLQIHGYSQEEIADIKREQLQNYTLAESCDAFSPLGESADVFEELRASLRSEDSEWPPSSGSLVDTLEERKKSDFGIRPSEADAIINGWPSLIVSALGRTPTPEQVTELRRLSSFAGQLCEEENPGNCGAMRRCGPLVALNESCEEWNILNSNFSTIQSMAKETRTYLQKVDLSRVQPTDKRYISNIENEKDSIERYDALLSEMAPEKRSKSPALKIKKRAQLKLEQLQKHLDPSGIKACRARQLPLVSTSNANGKSPKSKGLRKP